MKSFSTIAAIALATAATAHPDAIRTRQTDTCILDTQSVQSSQDIVNSILQWDSDVNAVNSFLNAVADGTISDLGAAASAALPNAQDEPCQLGTLKNPDAEAGFFFNPSGTDALTCAVNDLDAVFGDHVIANLNTIIADPSNTDAVTAAVTDINFFRCCNVLPDADLIWVDDASDNGSVGTVPITAQRPNACSAIDCSGVTSCKSLL